MRPIVLFFATVVLSAAVGVGPAVADHPPTMLGPGDANVSDLGGAAVIRMSDYGYVYISGKHNSHLKVTYVEGRNALRYRDTRTERLKSIHDRCQREQVEVGISVVCTIPPRFRDTRMFVQVWPRLGNDYVDGRTLPRKFRLWVLADAGQDVVYGGAGNDFVNAAKGDDRVYGGPGRDWLRGGPGYDRLVGGSGRDRISQG